MSSDYRRLVFVVREGKIVMRRSDPSAKMSTVLALPGPERYAYFVRKVTDTEMVWGLYDNGWAMAEANGAQGIPFWPEASFAACCATGNWQGHVPRQIALAAFTSKWLTGMHQDHKLAVIFPTPADKGCVALPPALLSDIEVELQQYR